MLMPQGIPIATGTLTLSTTESANQVQQLYDYIKPGTLYLYCKASAAVTTLCNFFVNGQQILRRATCPFAGTQGTLSTADNLWVAVRLLFGGRAELTFVATTGTPTVDFNLSHDAIGGALGAALNFAGNLTRGR